MHLCLTVECITSGLHLSVFLIRSHPPPRPLVMGLWPRPPSVAIGAVRANQNRLRNAWNCCASVRGTLGGPAPPGPVLHVPHQTWWWAPSKLHVPGKTAFLSTAGAGGGVTPRGTEDALRRATGSIHFQTLGSTNAPPPPPLQSHVFCWQTDGPGVERLGHCEPKQKRTTGEGACSTATAWGGRRGADAALVGGGTTDRLSPPNILFPPVAWDGQIPGPLWHSLRITCVVGCNGDSVGEGGGQ